jgi:hypothetical protein
LSSVRAAATTTERQPGNHPGTHEEAGFSLEAQPVA